MGCSTSRGAKVVESGEEPEERPDSASSTKNTAADQTDRTSTKDQRVTDTSRKAPVLREEELRRIRMKQEEEEQNGMVQNGRERSPVENRQKRGEQKREFLILSQPFAAAAS
ncbi:hypothetical protein NHX12_005807 [Muraenolepis orangiensis]|uniref:Uncharacterized protein n=1 Tax=Muraenolepis orangiensis TaxID=630683 RepID=A0A9Q0ID91_9TELE|nr:hypothetical protein NHX12_005807 [Muraenolepis orangiensis]